MNKRFLLLVFMGSLAVPTLGHGALEVVTVTSEDRFPAPRWMFGEKKAPKLDATTSLLADIKMAQLDENFELCLQKISAVRAKAKSLHPWLSVVELDCAGKQKPSVSGANALSQALMRVNTNSSWLLRGPQMNQLRAGVISGYLTLIEQDLKVNRQRAWKSIESLQDFLVHMDKPQKARLWRMAGDLAFIEQKTEASTDYFRRSLQEVYSPDLRARLNAIAPVSPATDEQAPSNSTESPTPSVAPGPEASADELQIADRMTAALKSGDMVSATEDAIKMITSYPGSTRAKWASDRVLDAYLPMIDKTDPKYTLIRERIVKLMEKADTDRLADWSRWLFGRGQYADSLILAKRSLRELTGTKRTGILDLAAKAALASDQFGDSREYCDELMEKHSGTKESREAILRAGLLSYRAQKYPEAAALFERVTALPQSENLELSGRYWLWRSLQKMKSERAAPAASELIKRFPFSYYGLRARLETGTPTLEWKTQSKKITSRIWLTSGEKLGWERMQLLLKAGWLEEAQSELRLLPPPMEPNDKAVRALVWAATGQYLTASKLVNDAWDESGELRANPFLGAAFPNEFEIWILEQAKVRGLDPYLVKSLIKQESGYNARATSASNALGLMQMIPPTAKEIASDLRAGPLDLPNDLFQPKKNIQFGTYYLSRLVGKYQGVIPLALAAYNGGQGRIDRWLRARPSLKNLIISKSSSPDEEIWFDEIPYAETSFYVKAILRNLLIYRTLAKTVSDQKVGPSTDEGRVQDALKINDPLWAQ